MPDPVTTRIDVSGSANNSLSISFRSGLTPTVNFYTSGSGAVEISFTGTPPFTDTTNPFTVNDATGVNKTVSATAGTGNHNFTAGDRNGDIDITAAK